MNPVECSALTLDQVATHNFSTLRDLVKEFPALRIYASGGWLIRDVAIVGPPAEIARIAPRVEAWAAEAERRDAW